MMQPILVGFVLSAISVTTMNLCVSNIRFALKVIIAVAHAFLIPAILGFSHDTHISGWIHTTTLVYMMVQMFRALIIAAKKK